LVAEAIRAASAAWPTVRVSAERFRARLEELGVDDETVASRGADLFLAVACADGDPEALARFEGEYLAQVPRWIGRLRLAPHVVDEVRQQLRVKLLAGPNRAIATYSGRGPLAAWVRVSAVRLALDAGAAGSDPQADVAALGALVADGSSPETSAAKNRHRPLLQAALEETLLGLCPRDKTLLRLHYIDGLNIDAIGRIYRVHRATVARWLVSIREDVLGRLKTRLAFELRGNEAEAHSLVALFDSELHLSVQRLLGAEPAPVGSSAGQRRDEGKGRERADQQPDRDRT
jgi:RNA polymerase sigma-70 factor (ECF subfamily)